VWDTAQGVKYLHNLAPPVIHRDLKTPNVLLASLDPAQIVAKISDFGTSLRASTVSGRAVDNRTYNDCNL
jgi:serine/threonine protein kinase